MQNNLSVGGKSLFEELWEYFEETYFSPEIPALDNFDLGTGTLVSLKNILVGLTLGLILASFITIYNKRYIGRFVRKLLSEECISHESAKTLAGYFRTIVRRGKSGREPYQRRTADGKFIPFGKGCKQRRAGKLVRRTGRND